MRTDHHVTMIIHADWSKDPAKRWAACAIQQTDGTYLVKAPEQVQNTRTLLATMQDAASKGGCVLAGFDFPIGIPQAYAKKANIDSFLNFLSLLNKDNQWKDFFDVAEQYKQICLHRPFYPFRPGNTSRRYLENGLGIEFKELYRLCDLKTNQRRAACPIFWTLGGQQVGKAAITGWKEIILPAWNHLGLPARLWPFQDTLPELLQPGSLILAETYPAEFYHHLGVEFKTGQGGKRSQQARKSNSPKIQTWAQSQPVQFSTSLTHALETGFGGNAKGEDPFDAVVGLLGMINMLTNYTSAYEPLEAYSRTIEGWMLGLHNQNTV